MDGPTVTEGDVIRTDSRYRPLGDKVRSGEEGNAFVPESSCVRSVLDRKGAVSSWKDYIRRGDPQAIYANHLLHR